MSAPEPDGLSVAQARDIVRLALDSGVAATHPVFGHVCSLLQPFDAPLRLAARHAAPPKLAQGGEGSSSAVPHEHRRSKPPCWRSAPSRHNNNDVCRSGGKHGGRRHHDDRGRDSANGPARRRNATTGPSRSTAVPPHPHIPTPKPQKTDGAFFVSALNRLNRSNYARIQGHIKRALQGQAPESWARVVDMALRQACDQAFFVDLHVRLTKDLILEGEREHRDLGRFVRSRVAHFVDTFLRHTLPCIATDITADDKAADEGVSEEDMYCRLVKRRAQITGANKAVLRLETDPDKLVEYGARMLECVGSAVDHASLVLMLDFVMEYVSLIRGQGARATAGACCERADERYAEFGADHPQSRFRLQDVRRALNTR